MSETEEVKDVAKDPANEITTFGQIIAGALLVLFILIPGYIIIAWWPDKLPSAKDHIKPLYINERFHVRLAGIRDTDIDRDSVSLVRPAVDSLSSRKDSLRTALKDSVRAADSTKAPGTAAAGTAAAGGGPSQHPGHHRRHAFRHLIHINTLLLMLVAAAGFLGNMIYITSSFSTFIGAVKFRRSWLLWYFVKPFTAAGLALGVYFVFRGGFLNMSDDSSNINIYGLITISILTGLYTDRATLKLGEVVNTIFGFKSDENDHRPDKLHQLLKVTGFSPAILVMGKANTLMITGENLDKQKLLITINDMAINDVVISATAISFQYTPAATEPPPADVKLVVKDEAGKEYLSTSIKIK
jgi:hypothetical protein